MEYQGFSEGGLANFFLENVCNNGEALTSQNCSGVKYHDSSYFLYKEQRDRSLKWFWKVDGEVVTQPSSVQFDHSHFYSDTTLWKEADLFLSFSDQVKRNDTIFQALTVSRIGAIRFLFSYSNGEFALQGVRELCDF